MSVWVTLPLVLIINYTVDFTNPTVVTAVRVVFAIVSAAMWLLWKRIGTSINEADSTVIWVPEVDPAAANPLAALMGGGAPKVKKYKRTTYAEYEAERVAKELQAVVGGVTMPFIMSMAMSIHLPMAINVVTSPMNMFKHPLVRKYLLGDAKPGMYDESLTQPTDGEIVAPEGEAASPASAAPASAAPAPTVTNAAPAPAPADSVLTPEQAAAKACDEAIAAAWDAPTEPFMPAFEALAASGKPIGTHAMASTGWTALMVASGLQSATAAHIERLLALGASLEAVDQDGWTALHWATFNGRPVAVQALCTAVKAASGTVGLAKALGVKSKDNESCLDLAMHQVRAAPDSAVATEILNILRTVAESCLPSATVAEPASTPATDATPAADEAVPVQTTPEPAATVAAEPAAEPAAEAATAVVEEPAASEEELPAAAAGSPAAAVPRQRKGRRAEA